MDLKEDALYKPGSLEKRLRLRKDCKESADNKTHPTNRSNDECQKNDAACVTSQSQCDDDDSILDFKSPKKMCYAQPKAASTSTKHASKSKKKELRSKPKIIIDEKKAERKKTSQNRKVLHDLQQPSIESSFFKSEQKADAAADVKTAYVCPLCFKNLKDESLQAVHMKSCAIKNNVSTKKLMVAVELQERQAAERKSLGLLSAPVLQEKKKSAPRKAASHDDADLQLALALSKSLYEKEEMEEWDETQMAAVISPSPSLPDSNAEGFPKMTLHSFGFLSDRNISPADNLPRIKRKGKLISQTVLQRRTAVERERILAERIAEILMDCKDFTQRVQKEEKEEEEEEQQSESIKKKIVVKNQFLQELHQAENTLWDKTRLTSTRDVFYVNQLLPRIAPSEKKEREVTEEQDTATKYTDQTESNLSKGESLEKEEIEQEIKEISTVDATKRTDKEELTNTSSAMQVYCKENKFLDTFVTSWGNVLNDSSASDIIVFVKNDRHIWTHKLVFYVRCANILLDVISNDTEFCTVREKISWTDVDHDVAMAFLEFLYCGVIERNSRTLDTDAISSVRSLARRYRVNDLFAYLRHRESTSNEAESSRVRDDSESHRSPRETQEDTNDHTGYLEDNRTSAKELCADDGNISIKSLSEEINSRSSTPRNREFSSSPDMFEDTPDVQRPNDASTRYSKDCESSNIHVLLSLIEQDADAGICSQRSPVRRRTPSAVYSESTEEACPKNLEQDVIEIDSDPELDSVRSSKILRETSLSGTPPSGNSNAPKQKSNLTLFIEEMRRENAKSDSDFRMDSDMECAVRVSPAKDRNPFRVDRDVSDGPESCNLIDAKKKPGRLSVIERRMRSYANKNPEFYSRPSPSEREGDEQTVASRRRYPPEVEASRDSTLNNTESFVSTERNAEFTERATITQLSAACSSSAKPTSRSSDGSIGDDVEMDDEAEISMYSKYVRDHRDNSIAKYRAAIGRSLTPSNDLYDKSTSSNSIDENDECANDEALTRRDADVIVSSDTEIMSVSSRITPVALRNDDDDETPLSPFVQSKRSRESCGQDAECEGNNRSVGTRNAMTTGLKEQGDINTSVGSNRDKSNRSNTESRSDDPIVSFTRRKSKLSKSSHDNRNEFSSASVSTSSNEDFINADNQFPDIEHRNEFIESSDSWKSQRSIPKHSLNFEDDIYLANVDVERYERPRGEHVLERSRSAGVLSVASSRKTNARRCANRNANNEENKISAAPTTDDAVARDITYLSQDSASIRKFKKKSLSEGQIGMSRLGTSRRVAPPQLQCNYGENIGGAMSNAPKVLDRDITPSPDYDNMRTPELHKEMRRYGLKVQKRSRAVKLLSHIYNELHPLLPATAVIAERRIAVSSSEDEDDGPPAKKRNVEDNGRSGRSNGAEDDDDLPRSQDSNKCVNSNKDAISREMEFYETESLENSLENSSGIAEAFKTLINLDTDLYNRILQYEPIDIEQLRSTLKTHGFKCKLSNLMSYLDGQCITFYVPEQSSRRRIRKKK